MNVQFHWGGREHETKMSVINVKFETIVKSSKKKIDSIDYITII